MFGDESNIFHTWSCICLESACMYVSESNHFMNIEVLKAIQTCPEMICLALLHYMAPFNPWQTLVITAVYQQKVWPELLLHQLQV